MGTAATSWLSDDSETSPQMRAVNRWSVTAQFPSSRLAFGAPLSYRNGWTMLPAVATFVSYVHSRKRVMGQAALRAELVAIVVSIPVFWDSRSCSSSVRSPGLSESIELGQRVIGCTRMPRRRVGV